MFEITQGFLDKIFSYLNTKPRFEVQEFFDLAAKNITKKEENTADKKKEESES